MTNALSLSIEAALNYFSAKTRCAATTDRPRYEAPIALQALGAECSSRCCGDYPSNRQEKAALPHSMANLLRDFRPIRVGQRHGIDDHLRQLHVADVSGPLRQEHQLGGNLL